MSTGNIVKLDVGGTIFKTSKSTLTRFDGFFKTMLETDVPITKDESGAIFIDRSPTHFDSILNYMRDGRIVLPNYPKDVKEIQNEAQYYLLEGLVELCKSVNKSNDAPLVKRSFFAESDKKLTEMIANSTKKVLCVCYYDPIEVNVFQKTTKAMMLYGDKVDVCLIMLNIHHSTASNRGSKNGIRQRFTRVADHESFKKKRTMKKRKCSKNERNGFEERFSVLHRRSASRLRLSLDDFTMLKPFKWIFKFV